MQKIRVGVLMGGRSIEKEVSFNSGRTVCDHLDTTRYEVIPIFQHHSGKLFILPWRFLYRGKISDFEHRLEQETQVITWDDLKKHIDFMYLAVHGRYAEDGTVQGMLEILGIPYLGAKVFSSALGMDKIIQKDFLRMHGIDVPRDMVIPAHEVMEGNLEIFISRMKDNKLSFPCVVKPHKEGSSLGMAMVTREEELLPALYAACTIAPGIQQDVLLEEKIIGMEFTCIILTDYATGEPILLPPTEVVPDNGFFDYEQKYMPGRATKFTPARCSLEQTQAIQRACLQTKQALGFENIARIDGFLTPEGRVVIIDPNSLTGMAPSSFLFQQAAEINMNHTQLINHLIATELYRYGLSS